MTDIEKRFLVQMSVLSPNFSITPAQMDQFRIFYLNLLEWNKVMNLTTITEEQDVYEKHFLDSCSILQSVSRETFEKNLKIIDVGTGAGFPGIPLAILFPGLQITLLDSLNKRIRFLEDTAEKTGLRNVNCVHMRAEEAGRTSAHREKYDLVVSRAVAEMRVLLEYCLPLVRTGGTFVSYKSQESTEEMNNAIYAGQILGAGKWTETNMQLPGTEYKRTLYVFRKDRKTPSAYPRKAGLPAKDPLRSSK